MNKTELIKKVATETGYTQKDIGIAVESVVNVIVNTVASGEDVNIPGFGKFVAVDVAERTGTIMMGDRKGEKYVTPAHKSPKFKPATAFKTVVK